MNLHAVNDLIECSLQRWYRMVSEWRTPSGGTATGCSRCRASEFAAFDFSWQWPHDLLHALVQSLETVSTQLAASLHEERHCADENGRTTTSCGDCIADARSRVRASASRHTGDIADVIDECAMPRMAVYVEMNINLALNAATRGEWAS